MQISTKDWKNYIDKLTKLNTTAGKLMSDYVARNGFGNTDAILDYAYALVTKYGEGSAALSAEMYDTIAEMSGMILPPAEVAPTADYGEVAKAVQGTIKKSKNPNTTGGTISRLVKQAGADTMLKNAGRDHAQFAWVPMGDTCAFCMTLASRGWQYISAKSMRNGHAEHIHANCDCNYVIRFDDKSGVKGYDPEYYREMYEEAEGTNSKEKINSLRRMRYAERKDVINAQKRAAYAGRMTLKNDSKNSKIISRNGDYLPLSSNNMFNSMDLLYNRVKYIDSKPGYDDIFIHGNAYGVCYKDADGKEIEIPKEEFVKILKMLDLKENGLRLCSCSTGASTNGIADYIAHELKKEVLAPSKTLWLTARDPKTGKCEMIIAGETDDGFPDMNDIGKWIPFGKRDNK